MFYGKLGSLKTHFESLQGSCYRVLLNFVYLSGKFYKAKSTWFIALGEFCPYDDDVVRKCFRVLRMIRISLELCSTNFKRHLNCYIFKQFIPGHGNICLFSASLILQVGVAATFQACVEMFVVFLSFFRRMLVEYVQICHSPSFLMLIFTNKVYISVSLFKFCF